MGFPGGSDSKESACIAGDLGLIPESRRSPGEGNGNPLQYSCLENPMDGEAWQATVHGVAKSQALVCDFTFTFHFHASEKEMVIHSSILAWRIPGTEKPSGLPSMGSHRVRHDWSNLAAAAVAAREKNLPSWQAGHYYTILLFSCLVTQSHPTLCNPMDCSTPGFLVLHHLSELAQIHVPWVSDAI